jgi:hypothetical protein
MIGARSDAFLELVRRGREGRLKVFLGPAAGSGKTYRMLKEAHELKRRGIDVVIGFIETHGRPETAALVDGLEQVPCRSVAWRGVTLEELDVDAVIRRSPAIALVDEVAHTNDPQSKNRRRYEDIQALLKAGISVYCAFNIQHLESLNDVVRRLTGVKVRESIRASGCEAERASRQVSFRSRKTRQPTGFTPFFGCGSGSPCSTRWMSLIGKENRRGRSPTSSVRSRSSRATSPSRARPNPPPS